MAMPQLWWLVTVFRLQQPGLDPNSGHVGSVVDKVELGQVCSEYFGFPCHFSFHQLLHIHPSSGAGTIGQLVDVPSGLSLTPPRGGGINPKKSLKRAENVLIKKSNHQHTFNFEVM
jgi:hypothetical protein